MTVFSGGVLSFTVPDRTKYPATPPTETSKNRSVAVRILEWRFLSGAGLFAAGKSAEAAPRASRSRSI
jgi:hypothetical protein